MDHRAISITEVSNAPALWQEIVDASDDGWIWHTWLAHEFNLEAGREYGAHDLSFFVYEGDKAVGVVPLIVEDCNGQLQASYYSGFLPWPCCIFGGDKREAFEDFAFTELERRARAAGAKNIVIYFTPPRSIGDDESRVYRIAERNGYEVIDAQHHFTEVTPQLLTRVRSRYDYKHFSPFFELSIAEGVGVSPEVENKYFSLHILDAGGQFRSRESYARQADLARSGEGFYVVATHKETGVITGMSLIQIYKGTAYYSSVAVLPEMSKSCVGYQLQCKAVEELLARGIHYYDLGVIADDGPRHEASRKEKGIRSFKAKISGASSRSVYSMWKSL